MADSLTLPRGPWYGARVSRRLCLIGGIGLLACIAAAAGVNYYLKQNVQVWVVNGLPTAMTMEFDERQQLYVSEQSYRSITLPEGRHRVVIAYPDLGSPPDEFELRNEWWQRFLFWRQPMHVLAPGRTAVIAVERERQEAPGQPVMTVSKELAVGRLFATYRDIDLAFLDFPVRERGSTQTGPLEKTLLYVHREHPKLVVNPAVAATQVQPRDTLTFAETQLVAAPNEGLLLEHYARLALHMQEGDRCLSFIDNRLARRPLWHDWHRTYQFVADRLGRRDEVIHKYDAFVAQESQSPAAAAYSGMLYLRGRLEQDDERQLQFMQQAVKAHPGNFFAWYSQGFVRMAQGRLQEAEIGLRNAYNLQSVRTNYRDNFFEVAIALGRDQAVGRALEREFDMTQAADLDQQRLLLCALIASNQLEKLPKAQARFSKLANASQPGDPRQLGLQAELHLLYLQEQYDKILEQSKALENPRLRNQALFELGRLRELPEGSNLLDLKPPQHHGGQHILLCVAWAQLHEPVRAAAELQEAIQSFSDGSPDERLLAESLRHPERVTLAEVSGITISPTQKAVALLALVQNGAAPRKELLELATKLNFSRQFPHHFVKRTLNSLQVPNDGKRS